MAGEAGHVRDARVGDHELHARVALDQRGEVIGDRRQPAAAVDQDRHVPREGQLEHGLETLVADRELLCARMELDAPRAAIEAADRLLDGAVLEVEP